MIAPFPHRYGIALLRRGDEPATIHGLADLTLTGGPPPQFGGRDDWWSPEHLLLAATALCLDTTFQALAKRAGVPVTDTHCRAEGTLNRTSSGLAFTAVTLHVNVIVEPEHVDETRRLLHKAKNQCVVANALRVFVELIDEVAPAPAPRHEERLGA